MHSLLNILESNTIIHIDEASSELIREVQTQLAKTEFYSGSITGITDYITKEALANFKKSIWLGEPELIGPSTAGSLLEIGEHPLSEQSIEQISVITLDKTGASMLLPTGETVWQNQSIIEGIPLTWGEVTKNCTRIPESKEIVSNINKTTLVFGEIRSKWGSPIAVTSGYRPPAINKSIGGARNSQHIHGLALDIYPLSSSIFELLEVVKSSSVTGIGLGMAKGFIHIDIRPGNRIVFNY